MDSPPPNLFHYFPLISGSPSKFSSLGLFAKPRRTLVLVAPPVCLVLVPFQFLIPRGMLTEIAAAFLILFLGGGVGVKGIDQTNAGLISPPGFLGGGECPEKAKSPCQPDSSFVPFLVRTQLCRQSPSGQTPNGHLGAVMARSVLFNSAR